MKIVQGLMSECKGLKWDFSYTRKMTYQKIRLYQEGYWRCFSDFFEIPVKWQLHLYENGNLSGYLLDAEAVKINLELVNKFKDERFVKEKISNLPIEIEGHFEQYLNFVEALPSDFGDWDNAQILEKLEELYSMDRTVSIDFWILFHYAENALMRALGELLVKKGLTEQAAGELLANFSEPIKSNPLEREHLSLLNVALLDSNLRETSLERHQKEFAYMPMYDFNYGCYTLDYFREKLEQVNKNMDKSDILKELESIKEKYLKRKKFHESVLNRFEDDNILVSLLKFLEAYSYLKDEKPYIRDKGGYSFRNLFLEISKRLNLSLDETLFLTEEELISGLKGSLGISKDVLYNRQQKSIFLCKGDDCEIILDSKAIDDYIISLREKSEELKGLGVYPGKVKGKASLILSNGDFSKFEEGNILVTSATRPDFVVLMKKAAAIITNEGGLLSHAAIVSRELKIPCIVGTKNATKALKDGDFVEVDADKGIVKIIKKD